MCSKSFDFDWWPWLVIHEQEMTLKEVKQEDSDFVQYNEYSDFESVGMMSTKWIRKKDLFHYEFNEHKEELLYHYCPLCCQRQEPKILKGDSEVYATYKNKKRLKLLPNSDRPKFYCPKHKEQELQIFESGMYDTDYEINLPEKQVVFKPYYKALKEVPFRGSLSQSQMTAKRILESRS